MIDPRDPRVTKLVKALMQGGAGGAGGRPVFGGPRGLGAGGGGGGRGLADYGQAAVAGINYNPLQAQMAQGAPGILGLNSGGDPTKQPVVLPGDQGVAPPTDIPDVGQTDPNTGNLPPNPGGLMNPAPPAGGGLANTIPPGVQAAGAAVGSQGQSAAGAGLAGAGAAGAGLAPHITNPYLRARLFGGGRY